MQGGSDNGHIHDQYNYTAIIPFGGLTVVGYPIHVCDGADVTV